MLEIDLSIVSEQTKIKYKEFSKKVEELLLQYDEQDKKQGLTRLEEVKKKIKDSKGNWDVGISIKHDDGNIEEIPVSLLLAYEYCLATEIITSGEVKFEDMLNKLFNGVQKFRIGNPVPGMDDECLYGKSFDDPTAIPVTTKQYRIKMHAGAQHLDYFKDGKFTGAVFIFAKENIPDFAIDSKTGKSKSFKTDGIDFQELSDEMSLLTCFRQTAFHEWNHNAEKEVIEPNAQTIQYEYNSDDGKKYRNYEIINKYVSSEGITIQEPQYYYEKYQKSNGETEDRYYYIDPTTGKKQYDLDFGLSSHGLVDKAYCFSSGMTTREVMQNGDTKMHNQITEGFVEATARAMILAVAPDTIDIDEGRYYEMVEMAKRVFLSRDQAIEKPGITYSDFLMHSSQLKSDLESRGDDGKFDGLRYISDYADMVHDRMTPKKKLYESMEHIVGRLGIDVNEQVIKAFERLNLFGKSSISEQEKNAFRSLLMSGKTPDKDYVEGIITELVTYIDDVNKFFDVIPEKLGYTERKKDTQEGKEKISEQKNNISKQKISQIEAIIGEEKAKLLFCNPEFKNKMLSLNDNQLNIISKCIKHYEKSDKNADWIDAFLNIWIYLDDYSELMEDIGSSDDVDIAKLTKILQNENTFNIKNKNELVNFEQIKREQCDKWIQGDLNNKKKAVLYKIFGQSMEYTKIIIDKFGQDIENIDDGAEKDYVRSLIEIMKLQDGDVLSEIYENVNEIELLDEALMQTNLRQAYSKKFNEGLLDTNNLERVDAENLEEQLKGFEVYDAGTNFNILMTSIAPFYDNSPEDFYKDWNRAEIGSRYFCTNYIRNDMLGMVPIKHLAYGFNYMEESSLVSSGKEDIGARIPKSANLKYRLLNGAEEYLTPDTMINETEQYNDMQYKRIQSGEKKQPSYIIAFRRNGSIENLEDIVKGAKDWERKLPIVVVDVDKCLQSEKQKVNDMLSEYHLSPTEELAKQIRQKVRNNRVTSPEFCIEFQQELDLIDNTEDMLEINEPNKENRTIKIGELAENYETVSALEREGAIRQLYAQIRQRIENKENEDIER